MTTPADLPYGSTWRYQVEPEGAGLDPDLLAVDHDDTGWATTATPVGRASPADDGILGTDDWLPIVRHLEFTEAIYLRTTVPAVAGPYVLGALRMRRDCTYQVWVNGALVVAGATPGATFPGTLSEVTHPMPPVTGLLAVYATRKVRGGLDGWYLDLAVDFAIKDVRNVTRQWPRDSLGLAAGIRQYPPPRGARLVGGHQ